MKMMKKLGRAIRGGAVASSKNMAPAMGGAVAAAKTAQPMAAQAAAMPRKAPLSNLRASVKSAAANVKTAVEKQPALQKAVASQRNKPVGRVVGGLASKFLKRR